jgi:hypothetical protein
VAQPLASPNIAAENSDAGNASIEISALQETNHNIWQNYQEIITPYALGLFKYQLT